MAPPPGNEVLNKVRRQHALLMFIAAIAPELGVGLMASDMS